MLPDLDAARDAFSRGDFRETRRRAGAILASDAPDAHKAAARELLGRISNDRAVLVLLGACVIFFLVVVIVYVGKTV
jgi:hypothetical protein